MAYELPPLPYPINALEPHIDAKTMEIHHDKHHQAYITNANNALKDYPQLAAKPVEELIADLSAVPEAIRTVIRNNAGGHANHSFFWLILGPNAGGSPKGKLADAITSTFGSFHQFKEKFQAAGAGRFGSGWAWLVINKAGSLEISSYLAEARPLSIHSRSQSFNETTADPQRRARLRLVLEKSSRAFRGQRRRFAGRR
jgi:superoxide dismutase, Fe-Mn family